MSAGYCNQIRLLITAWKLSKAHVIRKQHFDITVKIFKNEQGVFLKYIIVKVKVIIHNHAPLVIHRDMRHTELDIRLVIFKSNRARRDRPELCFA
jgi:hypothetical protein